MSYRPGFNADEAIWGWAREEVTANLNPASSENLGLLTAKVMRRFDL